MPSRGWSRGTPTRSRASPTRSPTSCASARRAGTVVTISNGSDFDDFAGLERHPSDRFRLTHTGSFFGKRDPRPFLTALEESGLDDVVVRFLGDFRSTDREWAETRALGDRLELIPYASRRRSLELQRDSEALLLLIPEAGGRGKGVLSREGVRVPRGRAADPRGRAAGRCGGGPDPRGRRGRGRRARRRRRDDRGAARPARASGKRARSTARRCRTSGGARSRAARARRSSHACSSRSSNEARHELPVPRERLLRDVREGALEHRRQRLARRRARDRLPDRVRRRDAALARAAHERGPRRLPRGVPARLPRSATSTSPTRTRSRSGGRA